MADPDVINTETLKARLRRQEVLYEARLRVMLESDRAALELGLLALKTAILMNAGAVVALLAFVGQLWGREQDVLAAVLRGSVPFVAGLIAGGVAVGIAYFYQCFVTANAYHALEEASEWGQAAKPKVWAYRSSRALAFPMVGLAAASYALFVWGAWDIVRTLAP